MGPFAQLRVLDLSPNRVGAQISQLFADFGAEVTWVEPPGGAELRADAAYPFWARGKRSIALDLHDTADLATVRALVERADVLIDTFRPGVLDRLGLGYDSLVAANPRLIHATVSGFGSSGPMANAPGYEGLVAAKLGLMEAFKGMTATGDPAFVTTPYASFSASQVALHGILAALHERERSGLGQQVETSLLHAVLSLDTWAWIEHVITERWPDAFTPSDTFDDEGRPMGPFPFFLLVALTADGRWMQFASVAPHLFQAMMKALGLASMFTDPEWEGLPIFGDDADKRQAFWERLQAAANAMSLDEWQAVFEADPDVFAEVFRIGRRVLEHPQVVHDGGAIDIVDAERGPVHQPGPIARLARTPAEIGASAPLLDEHRSEVLAAAAVPVDAHPPTTQAGAGLPLDGVTILELGYLFAAPHAATMLTDLGARVIKIEPLAGDPIRTIIAFPESGGFKAMQGKESICVDTSTPEGLALVQDLAADVDIVVQGFRAGAVTRMQLDYEALKVRNPDLIYVNAPGYGVDGPSGGRPAYAPSIGAATGMALTNVGHLVPEQPGLSIDEICDGSRRLMSGGTIANAQSDGFAALGVATSVLVALVARDRTGEAQEVFTSMLNTGAHAMSGHVVEYPGSPAPDRPDPETRGLNALYRLYPAADGWVFLAAPSPRDWVRLVAALDPALGDDSRFCDAAARQANDADLAAVLTDRFAGRGAAEWEIELLDAGVGCVAANTDKIERLLLGTSFGRDHGLVADIVHPTFEETPRISPYVRFSRSATQAKSGVLAGSHTDALLGGLGHDAAAIADLRAREIVG